MKNKYLKKRWFAFLFVYFQQYVTQVGIGTTNPDVTSFLTYNLATKVYWFLEWPKQKGTIL
jgi:hypothetical protein